MCCQLLLNSCLRWKFPNIVWKNMQKKNVCVTISSCFVDSVKENGSRLKVLIFLSVFKQKKMCVCAEWWLTGWLPKFLEIRIDIRVGSRESCGPEIFGSKNYLAPKKVWVPKCFGSWKTFGWKNLSSEKFWLWRYLGLKFESLENLVPKNEGAEKCWSLKILVS